MRPCDPLTGQKFDFVTSGNWIDLLEFAEISSYAARATNIHGFWLLTADERVRNYALEMGQFVHDDATGKRRDPDV